MTAGAARVFLPTLREVERELAVPIPDRVRLLRELEFDLEELRGRFEAEGMPADEARARALEVLVPDKGTLRELGWVHSPLYRRLTRHFSDTRLRIVERAALALSTAAVLLVGSRVLLRTDLLGDPSPFVWPVLGLGGLLFAVILAKGFSVWVKGDHRSSGDGLRGIYALAGTTLAVGVGGTLIDFSGHLCPGWNDSGGWRRRHLDRLLPTRSYPGESTRVGRNAGHPVVGARQRAAFGVHTSGPYRGPGVVHHDPVAHAGVGGPPRCAWPGPNRKLPNGEMKS